MIADEKKVPSNRRKPSFFNTPKGYVLVTLIVIMIIASMYSQTYQGSIHSGIAVFVAVLLDVFIGLLQKRKRIVPDGAAITGLIVPLVLSPDVPWYIVSATTLIAIVSKHLFKVNRKPIFNPAAFGLLISLLLFSSDQNWWGGLSEMPVWGISFVLIGGFIVTQRVNKFPQLFSFIGIYFLTILIMGIYHIGQAGELYLNPFINSVLFLAFFMVTDPPTSPVKYTGQIVFGGSAAIISILFNTFIGGLSFLFVGLLALNCFNAISLWISSKSRRTTYNMAAE
jgi:enediyne biosynthesis protein E5